jgi:curli production assembly/transport component CsgG/holdfast attachment protein HfaB
MRIVATGFALLVSAALAGCVSTPPTDGGPGVKPVFTYAVTNNDTPYSQCLRSWKSITASKGLPRIAVGEIADKTGQVNFDDSGTALSQGASEMVMSAFYKTGKAALVERLDLRIPLAEVKLAEQERLDRPIEKYDALPASDFVVVGAITELNYNIITGGMGLYVQGMGGGKRTVLVNVAMDLRVVDAKNFAVRYVTSLQKQIFGYEVQANVFRFFGDTLLELEAGKVQNEPMQLALRSIAEMSVYQIMTEFLGLPVKEDCGLVESDHMASYLKQIAPKPETETEQTTEEKT